MKYRLLVYFVICLLLFDCSGNKDDFAKRLAVDIVTTINKGSGIKEPTPLTTMNFVDASKGLAVVDYGVNIFAIPFIKDGLSDGYDGEGLIKLTDYESEFGTIRNQQLSCKRKLHVLPRMAHKIDYVINHLQGLLITNDNDSINVDYKFRYDNSEGQNPLDINTIRLTDGEIKKGNDVYDVVLGTHSTTTGSSSNKKSSSIFDGIVKFFSPNRSTTKSLEVNSTSHSTNIQLKPGDKVVVSATGTVVLGMFAGSTTPDGIDGYGIYSKDSNFKHGSLIGRIGNGSWFFVGSQQEITAQSEGELQLEVNDNDPSNNSGSFKVKCQIDE